MISPPLEIRGATVADAAAIARIHVRSWQVAYAGIMPAEHLAGLSVADRERRWREGLERDVSGVLVAVHDADVVGWLTHGVNRDADLAAENAWEIQGLYVDPDRARRGVGSALMAAVRADCPIVTLWTLQANLAAQAFYARHGFHPDGATKDWPVGSGFLPALRLRRTN